MESLKRFKNLKASSLLESVVAISILSICVLVAFSVYLSVVNKKKSVNYYNAKHKIEYLTQLTADNKEYEDDIYEYKGFSIKKEVAIDKENNLITLNFIISTATKNYSDTKKVPYIIERYD